MRKRRRRLRFGGRDFLWTARIGHAEQPDEQALEAASARVAPEALMFGISELARRAVVVLAQERGVPPRAVARSLLGLPEG
ncbi:hypothetical protein [Actinacidiphila glaucinigra]|uniref:hypothetical protein n=1 Tax=Actinacidiphila glaucinigra TaxID=235986 RepID=UPI00382D8F9C